MIDKKLLQLLGDNKKYILYTVAWMVVGLFANLTITACICRMIYLAAEYDIYGRDVKCFLFPAALGIAGMAVRYGAFPPGGNAERYSWTECEKGAS